MEIVRPGQPTKSSKVQPAKPPVGAIQGVSSWLETTRVCWEISATPAALTPRPTQRQTQEGTSGRRVV